MAERAQTQAKPTAVPVLPVTGGSLQRKCACGTHTMGDQCDSYKGGAGLLQRKAAGGGGYSEVPPIVHDVLRSPGEPLDTATRAFFEPRFGHDFSHVRVHSDAKAGDSARAIHALAYTVGNDVVFGAGHYVPHFTSGRQLLAHELTHVVQQTNRLQCQSIAVEPRIVVSHEAEELEREADDTARKMTQDQEAPVLRRATAGRLQRAPATQEAEKASPKEKSGSEKEDEMTKCLKSSGPAPDECNPSTALTWANFTGAPQAKGNTGASTNSGFRTVEVQTQACANKVKGQTTGQTSRFQAYMDSSKSWVKAKYKNAGDLAKNGGQKKVKDCETHFDNQAAAGLTGGWWAMGTGRDPDCPATAPARGDKATSKADCATVVGADYNDWLEAESERLLSHEQGHLDIICVLVKKANVALAAGADKAKISIALENKRDATQQKYDNESDHGCKAAQQATWKQNIAEGLKGIKIP